MFAIGTTLREARRRQGLDLAECEAATKIRPRYLVALEEEQFEILPEPAYVRGFLRTYAGFLGVDADLVVDEYDSRLEPEPPPSEPLAPPGPPVGRLETAVRRLVAPRTSRRRGEAWLLWISIGSVLVLAVIIWAGAGGGSGSSVLLPTTGARPARAAPTTARPSPAPAPVAARPRTVSLAVTGAAATSGSYLQVRRGVNGNVLFDGTVSAGTHLRWSDPRGLWIRVGWTPSLRARVDGRPAPLSGGTANFVIDRAGWHPAQ